MSDYRTYTQVEASRSGRLDLDALRVLIPSALNVSLFQVLVSLLHGFHGGVLGRILYRWCCRVGARKA